MNFSEGQDSEIPENRKDPAHLHYDVRFLLQASLEKVKPNAESKELLWIHQDHSSLPTTERSILRMYEKWLKLLSSAKTSAVD